MPDHPPAPPEEQPRRDHEQQRLRWAGRLTLSMLVADLILVAVAAVALTTELLDCHTWGSCSARGAPLGILAGLLTAPVLWLFGAVLWHVGTASTREELRLARVMRALLWTLAGLYGAGYVLAWGVDRTFE